MQPFMDLSMILSCGLLLGKFGNFFPHIYDMEEYVYSREALERLIESFLEAVFQSVVFYLGGSYVFQVTVIRKAYIISTGLAIFGITKFLLKIEFLAWRNHRSYWSQLMKQIFSLGNVQQYSIEDDYDYHPDKNVSFRTAYTDASLQSLPGLHPLPADHSNSIPA